MLYWQQSKLIIFPESAYFEIWAKKTQSAYPPWNTSRSRYLPELPGGSFQITTYRQYI